MKTPEMLVESCNAFTDELLLALSESIGEVGLCHIYVDRRKSLNPKAIAPDEVSSIDPSESHADWVIVGIPIQYIPDETKGPFAEWLEDMLAHNPDCFVVKRSYVEVAREKCRERCGGGKVTPKCFLPMNKEDE